MCTARSGVVMHDSLLLKELLARGAGAVLKVNYDTMQK